MKGKRRFKICFMGSRQAGIIGALTILSQGSEIPYAVSYSEDLKNILQNLGIALCTSVFEKDFIKELSTSDLLICVHGREVVSPELLKLLKLGCVNIHPFLYRYKGARPVERAFRDQVFKASVGAHIMESKIDEGKVLVEEFVDVCGCTTVNEIYNMLYPYYCRTILKVLDLFSNK